MKNHTHLPTLGDHYSQLLGLVAPWTIQDVNLDVDKTTLDVYVVEQDDTSFMCPECGHGLKDIRPRSSATVAPPGHHAVYDTDRRIPPTYLV